MNPSAGPAGSDEVAIQQQDDENRARAALPYTMVMESSNTVSKMGLRLRHREGTAVGIKSSYNIVAPELTPEASFGAVEQRVHEREFEKRPGEEGCEKFRVDALC